MDYQPISVDELTTGAARVSSNGIFQMQVTLSWVAWVRVFVMVLIPCLAGIAVVQTVGEHDHWPKAIIVAAYIAGIGYPLYRFVALANTVMYADPAGVWVRHGVFPWEKAAYGIRWGDLGSAGFRTGFWSWITGSYHISLYNRWKDNSVAIDLKDVRKGDKVVTGINAYLSYSN